MDVLIILFATGLISMFIAMTKKPILVLLTAVLGLTTAGVLMALHWFQPYTCISFDGLEFDQYAIGFGFSAIVFTFLIILAGYSHFKKEVEHTGEYISLIIFSLCGAICMLAFTDMFLFFLGLEILSIPIYVMAGSKKKDERSVEASLKYFFTGAFATGLLLFGIAWMYGAVQSFKIYEIAEVIQNNGADSSLLLVGLLLIMASFLFKIGAAPFHFWSPDVYGGSPAIVTGYMASVIKIAGLGAFFKILTIAFPALYDFWAPVLLVLSILTILVGNLSALRQVKFKRFFAYSSITHVGYAIMTLLAVSGNSAFNLWYYLFAYGFATVALILISVMLDDDADDISSFAGLAKRNPVMGVVGVIGLLSLAGVPPLMGFFGKYLVFYEAFATYPILVIFAIINSGIGMYYYLRIAILIVRQPSHETAKEKIVATPLQYALLIGTGLMILVGGICLC